ncbi:glycosyltransferase [Methylobacter sp. S3L5C]|uniref:glycosyltransferase n=1 Tax=Methylobacter sp. S3L5C TaxID=2839024 RepID=UPI001FABD98A|nr:glycosyltransferase [Methylobacter sp. S3L5C]UOA10202.1 glycosyltransferase family 2 protein [Methylobacter sp. S3L5C]
MISVIVCTYNRAPVLQRMLESFFKQEYLDYIDYEILIVDNNSQDETKSIVEEYLQKRECRYVFESKQGLSLARNRGVFDTTGEIVAFLDDDVIVDKYWLKSLNECYQETNADVVGGRAYLIMENDPPEWLGPYFKILLSEVDFGDNRQLLDTGIGLWGLNLSFRRSALSDAGGFDAKLGRVGTQLICAEESVVIERLAIQKKLIFYEPKAIVGHIIGAERLEWDYFLKLAVGQGKTKDLIEPQRGICWQLLRVARSLLDYGTSIMQEINTNKSNSNSYEKKLAKWQAESKKYYLIARWKHLFKLQIAFVK